MLAAASNSVFVSYRRDVSQYMAMALWQNLTAHDIDVFYDIESIKAGKFDDIILSQIAARPYMVPILVPGSLNRCVDKGDWLRRELEAGIEGGRMLVPVHTPEFDFDDIDQYLPAGLATELRRFQMIEIPPRFFRAAIDMLADEFLVPIRIPLTDAGPEATAAAQRQAAASESSPAVTTTALTAEEHFARGQAALFRDESEAAIPHLDAALGIDQEYVDALLTRAFAHLRLADLSSAINDLDQAIAIDPDNAEAYALRSSVRSAAGSFREARSDLYRAVDLAPRSDGAFVTRGNAFAHAGDYWGAIDDYDHAIRLNPDNPLAFFNRGKAYRRLERHRAAIDDFDEAIRLSPRHERARKYKQATADDLESKRRE